MRRLVRATRILTAVAASSIQLFSAARFARPSVERPARAPRIWLRRAATAIAVSIHRLSALATGARRIRLTIPRNSRRLAA